jgi:hypothetical protein
VSAEPFYTQAIVGPTHWWSPNPADNPAIAKVRKREIDHDSYKIDTPKGRGYRNAFIGDVSRLYHGNWLFFDEDLERVVMAYLTIPEDCSPLIPFLKRIDFTVSNRNDGTPTIAKTVGWLERRPTRQQDFCRLAGLRNEDPAAHEAILSYAEIATRHYQTLNPELYGEHMGRAEALLDEYRVAGTPFTSGIVNKDNVLPYHFDRGNITDVWSLMLGFKKDVGPTVDGDAGFLVVPEYDLALEIADNTLSGFDGQVALHGVTPFRKLSRGAYRFTIVYYAKAGIWQCLSLDEELQRGKRMRTKKETDRWERAPRSSES